MSTYQKFAKEKGYQLFLVMQGFGNLNETLQQRSGVFTVPLYAMDADYYNSRYSWNFSKYFENDLRRNHAKLKTNGRAACTFLKTVNL